MTWLYVVILVVALFLTAFIYDHKTKRKGQSFNSSFDGTKDQRQQNPQAQNDLHQTFRNNDTHSGF